MGSSKTKKNIFFWIFGVGIPIVLAAIIYFGFRSKETVFFQLCELLIPNQTIIILREFLQQYKHHVAESIIYSLPGALWIFAFSNFTWLFRKNQFDKTFISLSLFFYLSSILLEIGQLVKVTDGVFDFNDVIYYTLAILLAFTLSWLTKTPGINEEKTKINYWNIGISCLFISSIFLADVLVF